MDANEFYISLSLLAVGMILAIMVGHYTYERRQIVFKSLRSELWIRYEQRF